MRLSDLRLITARSGRPSPLKSAVARSRGLLPVGTVLQGIRKHQTAKVRADGTLVTANASGSIHQMGAHVQGLDACNGWTFWQFEMNGALVPIDVLRQQLRSGLS